MGAAAVLILQLHDYESISLPGLIMALMWVCVRNGGPLVVGKGKPNEHQPEQFAHFEKLPMCCTNFPSFWTLWARLVRWTFAIYLSWGGVGPFSSKSFCFLQHPLGKWVAF